MSSHKRRLSESEIEEIRAWFEGSAQGMKPTIRQIARRYNVNQPSVVKSLGGWKGIKRGQPVPPPKFTPKLIDMQDKRPAQIDTYTQDIEI